MTFFRGENYEHLKEEMDEIVNTHLDQGPSRTMLSTLSIIGSSVFLRPFSAAMIIILFKLSGFSVVSHYTATFLEKAGINFNPLLGSTVIGAIRCLASLSTIVVLAMISKKISFIIFGLMGTLSMILGKSCKKTKKCLTNSSPMM